MSRMSRVRWLAIPAAGATAALLAIPGTSTHVSAAPQLGVPSDQFWAAHQESDVHQPIVNGVYQPNTDTDMSRYIAQAASLNRYTDKSWRNAGPFGGVKSIQGVGSGAEQLGAIGGIGTAITVDPTDTTGNTVYFGTHGGLWKSTDGGKTLHNLSDASFLRDSIGAIAVDPSNHNNVYVGTGVSLLTLSDDAVGVGTYVSHDGGKTFLRPTLNTHGYGTNAIAVLPNGQVFVGTNYGLWRSTDHGASFHQVALPTNSAHSGPAPDPIGSWVTAIAVRPNHPNEITVAVGYGRGKAKTPDGTVLGPGNGLYRSTTGGTPGSFHFLASTSGLHWGTSQVGSSSDPVGRISLAYGTAPGQDATLFALVSDAGRAAGQAFADLPSLPVTPSGNSVLNGLYESTNDAGSWTVKATSQTLASALGATTAEGTYLLGYGAGVQAFYNNWVLTDPVNPNRVYIGLEEAYQGNLLPGNLPLGVQWTAMEKYANLCGFLTYFNTVPGSSQGVSCPQTAPFFGGGSTHPDQHGFAITKTAGGGVRIYSGNDGGWWKQDAHTVTGQLQPSFENTAWGSLNTQTSTVLPWDLNFLQDGSIVAGLQDNGAIRIRKDGSAYNVCGGDGIYVFPGANSQSYYCGIDGQLILATRDDFHHSINVTPSNNATGVSFLSPYAVDLTDPNHLIAAAGNVDMTTAGPDTNTYDPTNTELLSSKWVTVFTPPAVSDPELTKANLKWDSSAVWVAGPEAYVGMCGQCRPSLSVGPAINDPRHVHVLVATNIKSGCSPTKGTSACWHAATGIGLPHEQISGIAVDPNDARTIYVSLRQYLLFGADPKLTGTQKVMVSHDAGDHFTNLTGNLPGADAHAIAIRDGRLVVATDVGIFTTAAGSTTWSRLGQGLPQVPFRSMNLDRTGRYVLAGAYGRGAWVYDFGSAAITPPTTVPHLPSNGQLSATGLDPMWPILGVALIALAGFVARRRRALFTH